jgi:hypothetical protein
MSATSSLVFYVKRYVFKDNSNDDAEPWHGHRDMRRPTASPSPTGSDTHKALHGMSPWRAFRTYGRNLADASAVSFLIQLSKFTKSDNINLRERNGL